MKEFSLKKQNINNLFKLYTSLQQVVSITIIQNYQDSVSDTDKKGEAGTMRAAAALQSGGLTVRVFGPFLWDVVLHRTEICLCCSESCACRGKAARRLLLFAVAAFNICIYIFPRMINVHTSEATEKSAPRTRTAVGQRRG